MGAAEEQATAALEVRAPVQTVSSGPSGVFGAAVSAGHAAGGPVPDCAAAGQGRDGPGVPRDDLVPRQRVAMKVLPEAAVDNVT